MSRGTGRRSAHRGVAGTVPALAALVIAALSPVAPSAQEGASEESATESATAPAEPSARSPGEVSNVVEELSQTIYSPYCPGKTLAMCPSGGAAEVRRDIQEMARRGLPEDEIRERVIEEHGEEYRLNEPPTEDNYPLVGVIVAALLVCIVAVLVFSRAGGSSGGDDPDPAEGDLSEEDELYLRELRSQYRD